MQVAGVKEGFCISLGALVGFDLWSRVPRLATGVCCQSLGNG